MECRVNTAVMNLLSSIMAERKNNSGPKQDNYVISLSTQVQGTLGKWGSRDSKRQKSKDHCQTVSLDMTAAVLA